MNMSLAKSISNMTLVAIFAVLMAANASAQQPTAAATPAPRNPNWCPDVPASPPPPHYQAENRPNAWAAMRKRCTNAVVTDRMCMDDCGAARELWQRAKDGTLNQPVTYPLSTDKLQGPFPLQGGAKGWVLPVPSGLATPAVTAPTSPQGSIDPPGPFLHFSGADTSAVNDAEPPDVAADVSSLQNVEFVNGFDSTSTKGGLYVFNKTGSQMFTNQVTFWCGLKAVNGALLPGCTNSTTETLPLTDTQIGFVPTLGRWIATEMASDTPTSLVSPPSALVYVALSDGIDANGTWAKWSVPVCITDPMKTIADQPLLGWSSTVVAIDVVCHDSSSNIGSDNLLIIPVNTLTSRAQALPPPIQAPCSRMAPARDEQGNFSNLYLLASVVPTTTNIANCVPSSSNTEPYIVEYTATASGVFGSQGCIAGNSGCSPVSVSPEFGMPGLYTIRPDAQQLVDPANPAYQKACAPNPDGSNPCDIRVGPARITAAQIRVSNVSGTNSPILATGFSTGISASGPGIPFSQDVWFIQSLGSGTGPGLWLTMLSFAGGNPTWIAYPTIAIDNDSDFYFAATYFSPFDFPLTVWQAYTGLLSSSPTLLGGNTLETSNSTYTGQAGNPLLDLANGPQHWGDYNTMIYDPREKGPDGESSFWQVEEISKGGSDQSTTWEALGDPTPLPFFVPGGSDNHESECANNTCGVKATIPSAAGVQNGDLILVALVAGEATTNKPGLPDTTWTLMHASNITGSPNHISVTDTHITNTSWLAAHIYGTSAESGSYVFTQSLGNAEQGAFMVIYRNASPNLSSYIAYAFKRGGDNSSFNMAAVSPPGGSQLVAIAFADASCELPETTEPNGVTFASPSGVPGLTPETTLTPSNLSWLASDTSVPQPGQSYGPYTYSESVTGGCSITTGGFLGWEVAVPEL
jgi:hypothetical protein